MELSVWKEEMIVGSLNIVAAFSAILAGFFANRFGRRSTLELAALVFFVGAVLLAAAPNFESLMAGRVLTGIGVGFAMMIGPLYSAEISPANVRGFLVSFTEIFVDVGIVLGYIVGFAFQFLDPKYNWRLMLGVAAIPAVLLGLGAIFFLPESPRWLVMRGRYDEAMCVLEKTVCPIGDGGNAQERLEEIIDANELELGTSLEFNGWWKLQFSNISEVCCSPSFQALAKMYCTAIGINFFQQAAGIEATVYYSPVIFKVAGVTTRLGMLGATLCVGVVKLAFVLVATFTLDKVGRKKLLILSSTGMVVSLIVVCATFKVNGINIADATSTSGVVHGGLGHIPWSDIVPTAVAESNVVGGEAIITVVAICSFVAFFSMGWGPIVYVISSEIFPPKHRSKALGWSMFVNRVVSGGVAFTFLSIAQAITLTGTFAIFCATIIISVVFTAYMVPETKGRSLEELGGACSAASLPKCSSSTSRLETPLIIS
ncbi:hypothetical protein GOP47_0000836 [Adiantum capillus-veneris]|uniref:Major facilitator superfamily (MFS) profile domain-containing protein n=1 Tax=Adiantum capillus-veneris TaxID=13818 RepID=A0A9D4ZTA8_ADICA|nr:hypothetical protein GOP47_0000836 [Adiantum capillus-veneris]